MNMKLQGSDSWDKESHKEQQQKASQGQHKKTSLLYEVSWFPMTTSPWIASIAFIYLAYHLVHTLNFYFTIYEKMYGQNALFTFTSIISPSIVSLGYVINILLNILCVISFFFNDLNEEGLKYLVAWLGNKIYPVIRYLIEINLAIAGIIFFVDDVSAGFFVITAVINLFITFFAQNYILRKDYLCCKNVAFLLLHKTVLIIGYGINCVGHRVIQNKNQFLVVLGIHLFMASVLLLTYFIFGFNIYRHTTPRVLLVGSIAAYMSLSLAIFYDEANRQYSNSLTSSYVVYQLILLVFWIFFSYSILQSMKRNGIDKRQKNFKKKVYFSFNVLEGASQSLDDDCLIRGILRYHIKNPCPNENCFINRNKQIYDSKKNKECFLDKINQGKTSLTKFYLKCMYEQKLNQQKWSSTELVLDYIEFFYMKLKNIFKVTHLITSLQAKYLTPFQKLRLERIKKTMRQENEKLNNQLYLSQLDVENIINAENRFQEIKGQICQFLKRNLVFWKYVQKDSIDLSEMSAIVQPNFKLIETINNKWKQLAKYFQIQKRWKFYYVCYTLYVKNQKVKPQFIQYFGTNVHQEQLFSLQTSHIDKTTQQQKLYNPKMLFEANTCFIHINSHHQKSIIKKVSKYFCKMFKYQPAQILQSPIEVLMPQSIKKIHHEKFLDWAGQGKSNNQSTYQVKKIFPVTKHGFIIPVYKFYKQVLYLDRATAEYELQYIAMIKKNKEDQLVAIVNENFQIQAFSETLARKLKLKDQDYFSVKKLNILSFCPSLLKYTKFQSEILKQDDDFKKDENKKTNVSHQISNPNPDKQRKYSRLLETKKQMTESNCKLLLPSDMRTAQELYKRGLEKMDGQSETKTVYGGIREVYYNLKKTRQYRKFKSEIEIKQKVCETQTAETTYFEIYFRDMQQNSLHGQKQSQQAQQDLKKSSNNATSNPNLLQHQPQAKSQQQIIQQDFHLFFQTNNNSQSISIAFTNNIFIKQDNNKPVEMISHVSSITITVRIFFVLFMCIVITAFLLENINSSAVLERGVKLKLMTEFQMKMYMVQNALFGTINKVENMDWVNYELTNKTMELVMMKEDYYMKKIILDQTINRYNMYKPFTYTSDFATPTYDQIDLIDLLIEKVISFRFTNYSTLIANNTQFATFKNYMLPSFNDMANRTKIELNAGFQKHFYQTEVMTIVLYIIETLLLFLGFFVVLTRLMKISNSFIALMEIFTQLSEADVKKTWRYSEYTMKLFIHLNQKDQQMSQKETGMKQVHSLQNNTSLRGDQHLEQQVQNANLNKKVKKVQIGEQLTKIKIKSIVFIIIFLVIYGLSSFAFNIFMSESVSGIQTYKNKGYDQLFKYIPNLEIAVLAMHDKYSGYLGYNNTKYQEIFSNLQMMKDINTVFDTSTQFQKQYRTVFFDDFCLIHPDLFTRPQVFSQCRVIAQNTLQHGVQSFLYYLFSDVTNTIIPKAVPIQLSALKDNHLSVKIIDYYLLDLMDVWQGQFNDKIHVYKNLILIVSISLILFHILVYIILVEVFIVGNMKEKYEIFKTIYLNYMPDFVVSKEKIIKAKLHVEGFLEK